ncbi:hypothetical protein [Burkholderia glumae]|uniref:hypothetical protein n=1 Tax=Burkholderia glumae TaxID=337 RepID=UPI0021506A02|nr:hypothetical protein [Burkholderia glumae]
MSGYIFVSPNSDPGMGHPLADPILRSGVRPTMGTCRPDLRRLVKLGGQIFVISGSMGKQVNQYVIGGLEVDSKLESQLAAYEQFPENRLSFDDAGHRQGNIIVTASGDQDPRDSHTNFERRIRNYLVGKNPVVLETPREIALGREHSLRMLAEVFDRPRATNVREIIGRMRKLSDAQVDRLRDALLEIKSEAR